MMSGMGSGKDLIEYWLYEFLPENEILNLVFELYNQIFENAKKDFFFERIHQKENILIVLAYEKKSEDFIGFKIGYKYNENTFYSWVGGVLSIYRKLGIAQRLIEIQHNWAKENGFGKIRTKSMNKYKPMIQLNLKNGFDIIQVYTNNSNQTKIVFEKSL